MGKSKQASQAPRVAGFLFMIFSSRKTIISRSGLWALLLTGLALGAPAPTLAQSGEGGRASGIRRATDIASGPAATSGEGFLGEAGSTKDANGNLLSSGPALEPKPLPREVSAPQQNPDFTASHYKEFSVVDAGKQGIKRVYAQILAYSVIGTILILISFVVKKPSPTKPAISLEEASKFGGPTADAFKSSSDRKNPNRKSSDQNERL
jgi:hypothetical protein